MCLRPQRYCFHDVESESVKILLEKNIWNKIVTGSSCPTLIKGKLWATLWYKKGVSKKKKKRSLFGYPSMPTNTSPPTKYSIVNFLSQYES